MLSEAKHLWPTFEEACVQMDPRLKAWRRGRSPLRCSFAPLRMTEIHAVHEKKRTAA